MAIQRRQFLTVGVAMGLVLCGTMPQAWAQESNAAPVEDTWPGLVDDLFKGRTLVDGTGLLNIDAPSRAEDAALVPIGISLTLPADDARKLARLWLVVDQNPSPLVGTFEIGPKSGLTTISTRIRVNTYSNVHAVAELSDGTFYMSEKFVKAAGGCSAPAAKKAGEADAWLGHMRLKPLPATTNASSRTAEALFMMRHPNNSGLQMDQVTHLYVPAHFVQDLKIWQGDDLVLSMEGGISISEDPNFRFNYAVNGAPVMRARAVDTQGGVFENSWPIGKPAT